MNDDGLTCKMLGFVSIWTGSPKQESRRSRALLEPLSQNRVGHCLQMTQSDQSLLAHCHSMLQNRLDVTKNIVKQSLDVTTRLTRMSVVHLVVVYPSQSQGKYS